MSTQLKAKDKVRRYDLDWVRVIVFGLLILFHVGMFFVPWGWHIKNNVTSGYFALPMAFLHEWRLPILFMVSGMGTYFGLKSRKLNGYINERSGRLLIPLLFGMVVIIPPQVYFERVVDGADYASIIEFYPNLINGIYPRGNLSWHHLWFLPYLYIYSLLFAPVFFSLRNGLFSQPIQKLTELIEDFPLLLYLLCVPLILIHWLLSPHFPVTAALYGDWYALSYYAFFFLYGYLFMLLGNVFWSGLEKIKFHTLIAGFLFFSFLLISKEVEWPLLVKSTIKVLNVWSWILTIFGFASKFLNQPSKTLTYCNTAVYPFYILHQTITITIGYYLMDSPMHIMSKFLLMTTGTFGGALLCYELLIKRIKVLRVVFGLKN